MVALFKLASSRRGIGMLAEAATAQSKCRRRTYKQYLITCINHRKQVVLRTFASSSATDSTFTSEKNTSRAQLTSTGELEAILKQFPPGIDYAFGYGSGVLRQQQHSTNTNPGMIDIIFAIDNPYTWHKHNLQTHSDHYSFLARVGGPNFVSRLQTNGGARIYFHPFVSMRLDDPTSCQREIKYGVVSTNHLLSDLVNWEYLYLAGRMHKPTASIDTPADKNSRSRTDEIEEAQRINLLSAVSASLLLLNNTIDSNHHSDTVQSVPLSQLYNTIASLSYTGDFRMETGAEDPNKVKKLVETPGMLDLWDKLYSDTLNNLQRSGLLSVVANDGFIKDNQQHHLEINLDNMSTRKELMQNLPPRLRIHSDSIIGSSNNKVSIHQGSLALRQELANIVSPAAKSQSIKGFFTAGVVKSWKYALAKFAKGRLLN